MSIKTLLGWFGGSGFGATLQFFEQQLGIPSFLAAISILVEFFGGLMLIFGIFTRVGAALIAINMAVALFTVHLSKGFFIADGGIEFVFALLSMALYLAINGGGELSVDRYIREKAGGGTLGKLLS